MDKSHNDILEIFRQNEIVKICAPMVRYSKVQFRTLTRLYGADICYTPMILADSFCLSQKARNNEFTTHKGDTPLIVQFAAKTVHDFVGAAHMVVPYSDGVELNCGCPQRWALQDGYGCALLKQPELLADLIKQCRSFTSASYTVSAKIRLLNNVSDTVNLCRNLENCGVSYIVVHGRTAAQRTEPVNVDALREIKKSIKIPLVANGDIKSLSDAMKMRESTDCDGVMVARGLLTNPALFNGHEITPFDCVQKWVDICYNSTLGEATESVDTNGPYFLERNANLTFQCFHHHLVFMLEKILNRKQRQIFNNLQKFKDVLQFLSENLQIVPKIHRRDLISYKLFEEIDYSNRNSLYLNLQNLSSETNININKCFVDSTDGSYFTSTVQNCDLEEEDGEVMASLFDFN